jgi:hypothetical protein
MAKDQEKADNSFSIQVMPKITVKACLDRSSINHEEPSFADTENI